MVAFQRPTARFHLPFTDQRAARRRQTRRVRGTPILLPSPPPTQSDIVWSIDRYSFFHNAVHIAGLAFSRRSRVASLTLDLGDGRTIPISNFGLPSPEATRRHGRAAAACRFDQVLPVDAASTAVLAASLTVTTVDGQSAAFPIAGMDSGDPSTGIMDRFFAQLAQGPAGHLLEVGSRARTGTVYTSRLPAGWRYTGFDVMAGPNVDVVGDAHHASRFLPRNAYDAVMSLAVFEHLLMPWKAVIEINRLLKVGALGLIMAPQTWPLHEEPCDYFRFSKHAWKALFNHATGFEIIEAVQGPTAYVVPRSLAPESNFGEVHATALMACVMFRKVAETTLDWPVDAADIADDVYPM
jgi:hypothetical protein